MKDGIKYIECGFVNESYEMPKAALFFTVYIIRYYLILINVPIIKLIVVVRLRLRSRLFRLFILIISHYCSIIISRLSLSSGVIFFLNFFFRILFLF